MEISTCDLPEYLAAIAVYRYVLRDLPSFGRDWLDFLRDRNAFRAGR